MASSNSVSICNTLIVIAIGIVTAFGLPHAAFADQTQMDRIEAKIDRLQHDIDGLNIANKTLQRDETRSQVDKIPFNKEQLFSHLVGHWVNVNTSETMVVMEDGEVYFSSKKGSMQAAMTTQSGANIVLEGHSSKCLYRASVSADDKLLSLLLVSGEKEACMSGVMAKAQ